MTILPLLAAAAAGILGLGELPPQKLEPGQCLTFLWLKRATPMRIAMIDEAARSMRLASGKRSFDIPEVAPGEYAGNGYRIIVHLDFGARPGMVDGAVIDSGSLRIEPADQQQMAMSFPVGGMRSCAGATMAQGGR